MKFVALIKVKTYLKVRMHNMIQYKFMMHSFQLTLVEVCLSFFEFAPMKSCLLDLDSIINMVHALACTIE